MICVRGLGHRIVLATVTDLQISESRLSQRMTQLAGLIFWLINWLN